MTECGKSLRVMEDEKFSAFCNSTSDGSNRSRNDHGSFNLSSCSEMHFEDKGGMTDYKIKHKNHQ